MEIAAVAKTPGQPGWLEWILTPGDLRVLTKFEIQSGRGVITRMIICGEAIDTQTLKAIPVGRMETSINRVHYGEPHGSWDEFVFEVTEASSPPLTDKETQQIEVALDYYLEKADK